MPVYKFHYFDVRGRGEMVRMTLAAAGIQFEDIRYNRETWPAFKEKTPSKKLPVLEIDGEMLIESQAILRHIARDKKLYGETEMDMTNIETVLHLCEDIAIRMRQTFFVEDKEKLAEFTKALNEKMLEQIPFLENILVKNNGGKGWMVGKKMSIADIVMHTTFEGYDDVLEKHSKPLWEHRKRVGQEDKIKAYIEKRPKNPF